MFPHTIKVLDWGSGLTCTFDAKNSRRRTPAVTRERGAGIYILAEVESITHIRCLDMNVDDYGLVATHRSHVLGNIYYVGAFWQSWCRSLFERAQFAWSRFVTRAVTMTTRRSTVFTLTYWRMCNSHRIS